MLAAAVTAVLPWLAADPRLVRSFQKFCRDAPGLTASDVRQLETELATRSVDTRVSRIVYMWAQRWWAAHHPTPEGMAAGTPTPSRTPRQQQRRWRRRWARHHECVDGCCM